MKRILSVHLKGGTVFNVLLESEEAILQTEIFADWCKYKASFDRYPNWNGDWLTPNDNVFLIDDVQKLMQWRKRTLEKTGLFGENDTRANHFQFGFIGGVGWGFPMSEIAAMDATNIYNEPPPVNEEANRTVQIVEAINKGLIVH